MRLANGHPTVTSPVPREVWASVLKCDSEAVVTQSLPWRDAVFSSGTYRDVSRLYEFPSGQKIIVPLARHRLRPGMAGSWLKPWGSAGPISQQEVSATEAAVVLADLAKLRTLATEVAVRHSADEAWLSEAHQFKATAVPDWTIDLDGGFGQVWQHRFRDSMRRAVRKAERSGLDIEVDRTGRLIDVYHELHKKSIEQWAAMYHEPAWMTRLRLAVNDPPRLQEKVASQFGGAFATWVARLSGDPVAAIIIIQAGSYATYHRAAMDKERAGPVSANDLLHCHAIEEACQAGFRYYRMGYASPGSSLARYKKKLGCQLQFNHALRLERLPLEAARRLPREAVKKMVGFRDDP